MTPRDWRLKRKLTQAEAAAVVGVTGRNPSRTWQRWENGERKPPRSVVLIVEKLSEGQVSFRNWPDVVAATQGQLTPLPSAVEGSAA